MINDDIVERIDDIVRHCGNNIFKITEYLGLRIATMEISNDGVLLHDMQDPCLKINGVIGVRPGQDKNVPLSGHEVGHHIGEHWYIYLCFDDESVSPDSKTIMSFEIDASCIGADLTINVPKFARLIGYQSYAAC